MPIQMAGVAYNKYGSEQTLLPNNKYYVYLDIEGLDLKFHFTSVYDPFYCMIETIKDDIGPFIVDFEDDEIGRQIYLASKEAQEIARNPEGLGGGAAFDFGSPPYYVRQYVRHKAGYRLAMKQYSAMAKQAGAKRQLGDLSTTTSYSLKDLRELLSVIRKDLKPWEDEVLGRRDRGRAGAAFATRGGSTDSPMLIERTGF